MQPIVSSLFCAMWLMQGGCSQFLSSPFVFLNVLIFDLSNYGIILMKIIVIILVQ